MAQQVYGISKVMIPSEFSDAIQLVQQSFPSIDVEEFCEEDYDKSNVSIKGNENLEIPLNTLIHYSKRKRPNYCPKFGQCPDNLLD